MMKRATTACSTVGRAVAVEKFIETDEPRTETATRKEKQIELYTHHHHVYQPTCIHDPQQQQLQQEQPEANSHHLVENIISTAIPSHPIPSLLLLLPLLSEQVSLVPLRSTIGSFLLLVGVDRCPPSFGSY